MLFRKLTNRNTVFRFRYPDWHLNIHLICAKNRDYIVDTGIGIENMMPVMEYRSSQNRKNELVIINTHYHFDHTWGNYLFSNNIIISHNSCVKLIDENYHSAVKKYKEFYTENIVKTLPNLTFDGELYFMDDRIRIFNSAGHSPDGISVIDEIDGVLNVGDNIGDDNENILPVLECCRSTYANTIKMYHNLNFNYLLSGHNEVLDKSVLSKIDKQIESWGK